MRFSEERPPRRTEGETGLVRRSAGVGDGFKPSPALFLRAISLILVVAFILPSSSWAAKKRRKGDRVSARSAIFSNSTQRRRYYGKNVHLKVPPASTTKVMTALLVLERLPLERVVTAGAGATAVQPSKIYLRPGERFKVKDLLYALLLQSANDASIVLAEAVAGSEEKFVLLMNQRARQLGARHTQFANSHGLTDGRPQYTTAYDMYLIFRAALRHVFFRQVVQTKYHTIFSLDGRRVYLKSHNKSLFLGWKKDVYGKTGYTRKAKSCFVGYFARGKDILIIAVLGCDRRWEDIKYIVSRYAGVAL